MKNTMYLALIILAVLPASAQKAANPNGSTNSDDRIASAEDYAARVDGLLRDVHASLQRISARIEAGELTPEQGSRLKLAATRDVISRLDTLAAIYDALLDPKHKTEGSVRGSDASLDRDVNPALKTSGTVSVEELKREASSAAVTPLAVEITR